MIYKGFESVLVALTDVNNSFKINDCQRVKLNNIKVFEGFNQFVFFWWQTIKTDNKSENYPPIYPPVHPTVLNGWIEIMDLNLFDKGIYFFSLMKIINLLVQIQLNLLQLRLKINFS